MDKLKMQTKDYTEENAKKLMELFPNIVTESIDINGNVVRAIDKDKLEQEINATVVAGSQQRYEFTWPDKKQAQITARTPINKTLRPCREESVNFDTTENLYIEGDNLEVLKLLQETYLGKIKMIYIDPPYNTGHDFVYNDDFSIKAEEYKENSGLYDEEGNYIVTDPNLDSNGRFHTDWLNMMYPRLRLAKNLLTDDGVIFISIDDNEVRNLKILCDEIFGEQNFVNNFFWLTGKGKKDKNSRTLQQYIICYARNINALPRWTDYRKISGKLGNPDNDPRGNWFSGSISFSEERSNKSRETYFTIKSPSGIEWTRQWMVEDKNEMLSLLEDNRIYFGEAPEYDKVPRLKIFENDTLEVIPDNIFSYCGTSKSAQNEIKDLFDKKLVFDTPKPAELIRHIVRIASNKDSIILDFFSGSATTAHAVMQLNVNDDGTDKRKYIMVQLPEKCDEKSEAFKAGYKNICEIGKERIRRAGKKVVEDAGEKAKGVDIGFRVFKVDSSNMKDGFYLPPSKLEQEALIGFVDNVKEDRTSEDLLFQALLETDLLPSNRIDLLQIGGKQVYSVVSNEGAEGYLLACFDRDLTEEDVTEIAKLNPVYFVTCDGSIGSDSLLSNFEQIFKTYDVLYDKDRTIKMIGMR